MSSDKKLGSSWTPPSEDAIENLGMHTFSDEDFGGIQNDSLVDENINDDKIVKGKNNRRKNTLLKKSSDDSELPSDTQTGVIDSTRVESDTNNGEKPVAEVKVADIFATDIIEAHADPRIDASESTDSGKIDIDVTTENETGEHIANIFADNTFVQSNKLPLEKQTHIHASSATDSDIKEFVIDNIFDRKIEDKVVIDEVKDIFSSSPSDFVTSEKQINLNQSDKAYSKFSNWDMERKSSQFVRLTPIVEQILRVAGSDVDVQKYAHDLVLTTNPEVEAKQKELILDLLRLKIGASPVKISNPDDSTAIFEIVYDELLGLSVIGDLWRDDEVTEIMVDRWDRITVEKNGKLVETTLKFKNAEHAASVARNLAIRISDRALSSSIPLVTAELPNARVTFAFGAVVKGGLSITLRKFRRLLTLDELKAKSSLNEEMVNFLSDAVRARAGILVSGGTGTGKTTIINLLSTFIPENERVITIEDAFELNISAKHVVSLQTKEASSRDDQISITMADLLRNTLRMRPDRIIVGEIREGEGASVMLAAANTGHDGTMTTIHASSANLALNERLVDLVRDVRNSPDEAIKRTIMAAFDVVVQVSRGRKGQRYISDIAVVDRSNFVNNELRPLSIFIGEEAKDGTVKHRRAGKVDPNGLLGLKLSMIGVPEERWG